MPQHHAIPFGTGSCPAPRSLAKGIHRVPEISAPPSMLAHRAFPADAPESRALRGALFWSVLIVALVALLLLFSGKSQASPPAVETVVTVQETPLTVKANRWAAFSRRPFAQCRKATNE